MNLRIGSRGSQLALWQANHIAELLREQGHTVDIRIIKTTGDRLQEVTFALREGVEPRRVATLARDRGVAFDLTRETESQLQTAGADSALLAELKKIRGDGAKQSPAGEPQRAQAVKDVGRGFRVTAEAPDGVVEGLEDPAHPFYMGVQWHPEDMPGEKSASAIFGAFVEAARKYAEKKRQSATDLSPAGIRSSE